MNDQDATRVAGSSAPACSAGYKYRKVNVCVGGEWLCQLIATGETKPASHWGDVTTDNTYTPNAEVSNER